MKYTIFGGNGFIGRNLVSKLLELGHECIVPARNDQAVATANLGHVIYAIGITSDFRSRFVETMDAHVNLITQIIKSDDYESLVYLSSTRVYRSMGDTSEVKQVLVDPCNVDDLYGISKLAGESICLANNGKRINVARLSNVYGLGDDSNNFLISVLKDVLKGKLVLRTDLNSSKDYVAVHDVVQQIINISQRGTSKIYNIGSGVKTSHLDVLNVLGMHINFKFEVQENAPLVEFPDINISKLKNEFNYKPTLFEDYMPSVINSIRDQM